MKRRRIRTEIQLTCLNQMFAKHGVPSTGDFSWPARTPHVSACDLFLLGF